MVLIIDVISDMLFDILFPILITVPPIMELIKDPFILGNLKWILEITAVTEQNMVQSSSELFMVMCPLVFADLSLRAIHQNWCDMAKGIIMKQGKSAKRNNLLAKLGTDVSITWGIFVLILAVRAPLLPSDTDGWPNTCGLQLWPWGAQQHECYCLLIEE